MYRCVHLNKTTRKNKSFIRTPAEVKTEGNGTPLSPGPWGSLPGPELSRSRRLDPSGLDWAMLDPSNRLLNSLGLEAEGFDRALSESRPNGGRLSRLIMERSEPDSGRTQWCNFNFNIDFDFFYALRLHWLSISSFQLTLGVILGFLCGQVCQPVQSRAVALSWWARFLGRGLDEVTGGGCATGGVTGAAHSFSSPTVWRRCCLCSFCFDRWCFSLWFWSGANTRSCSCEDATTACCRLLRQAQPDIISSFWITLNN